MVDVKRLVATAELGDRTELKRLTKQQLWILVPRAIIGAALWQSYRRAR